eukprot:Skav229543  [mRNA]  locus=scaffold568:229537:230449:+ [translate_table: standard]
MKMRRKLARQMRREQRQLKREEHERLRQEIAHADGWQDAIGQLIEAFWLHDCTFKFFNKRLQVFGETHIGLKKAKKQKPPKAKENNEAPGGPQEGTEAEGTLPVDGEGNPLPQPVPNDPLNPLNAAYDMRAYALLRKLRLDEEHQISQDGLFFMDTF